jgi:prolyl-tRNA synthetase
MGALVEIFHDEKGIKWPRAVAPFLVYLALLGKDETVSSEAEALYSELQKAGIEVLFDDRQDKKIGPGQKFADHELLGIPCRLVISDRMLEEDMIEFVDRETGKMEKIKRSEVVKYVEKFLK